MADTNETPEFYRSMAQMKRDEAAGLIEKYGQGVRPSWVSGELAVIYEMARAYDLRANQLEVGSPA